MMCTRKVTSEELLEAPAEGEATPDLDACPRALTRHTR